jgi:SPP1 family predicted phage head-tail adaptor
MTLPDGIAELREFVEGYMTDRTLIQRVIETEVEEGYPRKSLQTVEITKSHPVPVGQRELLRAQQAGYEVEAIRLMPVDTDVTEDDVVEVDGEQWDVTGIPAFAKEFSANLTVYLRRRT